MKKIIIIILIMGISCLTFADTSNENGVLTDAFMINPLPTIVGLLSNVLEFSYEGQSSFGDYFILSVTLSFGSFYGIIGVESRIGFLVNPFGQGIRGWYIGFYPGYFYYFDYSIPGSFILSVRTGYNWVIGSHFVIGPGTGVSYALPPYSFLKLDIVCNIGYAYKRKMRK